MMVKERFRRFRVHRWFFGGIGSLLAPAALAIVVPSHFLETEPSPQTVEALIASVTRSPMQPPVGHPRLYGDDAAWQAALDRWDGLDPSMAFGGGFGRGEVKNVAGLWWKASLGYDPYRNQAAKGFAENELTKSYYGGESTGERLRTLHLIRRLELWFGSHAGDHPLGTRAEFEDFKTRFVAVEMAALRAEARNASGYLASWHKGYTGEFFDLGALPAFEFWCLFLDIFWDQSGILGDADQGYVEDELSAEIDDYIGSFQSGHWNLHNGNNWTMVLNAAALYWAITFYYEDERAPEVLRMVLQSNWWHRDFFLADGAYVEGISYTDTSFGPAHRINRLLLTAFGRPMLSFPWARMPGTAQWLSDNILSDGLLVDFSDSWAKRGYPSMYALLMVLWPEVTGLVPYGSMQPDPCFVNDFFARTYFDHQFDDTVWSLDPALARDWYAIAAACDGAAREGPSLYFYPEYKEAVFTTYLPGSNPFVSDPTGLYSLAETTSLAVNATPNGYPHREIDGGGLLWAAFGDRLLWDYGYGEIARNGSPYDFYEIASRKGRYVPAGSGDFLEFFLKPIEGDPDWSGLDVFLKVRWNNYYVTVGDYLAETGADGWVRVRIPIADFNVPSSLWSEGGGPEPWAGEGIIQVGFKFQGAFAKTSTFGLDEMRLGDETGAQDDLLWYGDAHPDSGREGAIDSSKSLSNWVEARETSGGALDDGGWLRIHQGAVGATLALDFNDDLEERYVLNRIDNVPLGTNTLIVPNQFATNPYRGLLPNTNVTQLKDVSAEISRTWIGDLPVVELDQSRLYGAGGTEGPMESYRRWVIGLGEGSFLVVDAFRLKDSVEEKPQEFWYFKRDAQFEGCAHASFSETIDVQRLDASTLAIRPRCWEVAWDGASQTAGRMLAASLHPGAFQEGPPPFLAEDPAFARFIDGNAIVLRNRLGQDEVRQLFRYEADAVVSEDVRVFLLVAAPTEDLIPETLTLTKVSETASAVIFFYEIDGVSGHVRLTRNGDGDFELLPAAATVAPTRATVAWRERFPDPDFPGLQLIETVPFLEQSMALPPLSNATRYHFLESSDLERWAALDPAGLELKTFLEKGERLLDLTVTVEADQPASFLRIELDDPAP